MRRPISGTICQPLADDTLQRPRAALDVIDAEHKSIAVTEIKLRKITMQVLFLAVLIDAFHPTLENRIVVFN